MKPDPAYEDQDIGKIGGQSDQVKQEEKPQGVSMKSDYLVKPT